MKEELVRAAHYYYVEKLTQQEIAQKMAMSRQRVSRLLKRAEEEGVVEIRVHGYSESCAKLENQLRKKLRLDVARIVNSDDDLTIGEVAMDYIENHVTPGCSIGVAFGRTMAQLCRVQRRGEPGGVKVVQLLGGLNSFQNAEYRPDEVASRFAVMLGGTPYSLFIPAILNNVQLKDLIYAEEQFKPMLKMIDGIDVAVITAGSLRNHPENILMRDGYLTQPELLRLAGMGGVGDVCLHFIDVDGNVVDKEFDKRVVGITAEKLKQVPVRICVSYGSHKVLPIVGAARGGFMNILITSRTTAELILNSGLV